MSIWNALDTVLVNSALSSALVSSSNQEHSFKEIFVKIFNCTKNVTLRSFSLQNVQIGLPLYRAVNPKSRPSRGAVERGSVGTEVVASSGSLSYYNKILILGSNRSCRRYGALLTASFKALQMLRPSFNLEIKHDKVVLDHTQLCFVEL